MSKDPLDTLLEKLTLGDPQAAEQVFLAYEPYLRMVVRRQLSGELRAKFDSSDVVQSVWADLLDGFRETRWTFRDSNHLRAFLVKATRNRFIDRLRQHTPTMQREQGPLDEQLATLASPEMPRPSGVAQANELWERILSICPPAHLPILKLKRQGCSLDEITAQTGYHKSSVRRILYDLARRLGIKQRGADI